MAALEGEEYMKLKKIGNSNKGISLSPIYIATLLLKHFPRATKGDISLLSLQHVALAILYLLISVIPVQIRIFICSLYPSQ